MADFWAHIDLVGQQKKLHKNGPVFTLHDGPPFANGHLHLGHALNKIAKDFANRFWFAQGYQAPYTPGWDCHGLPIETKVEQTAAKSKSNLTEIKSNPVLFRKKCADFAQHWINIQRDEFLRMGLMGDFSRPYTTMSETSEALILQGLFKLCEADLVYQGYKPVLWSPSESTALAEAEVEYKDIQSTAIYVGFPVLSTLFDIQNIEALIWTTTPWTLPSNQAIAYGDFDYVLVSTSLPAGGKKDISGGERLPRKSGAQTWVD